MVGLLPASNVASLSNGTGRHTAISIRRAKRIQWIFAPLKRYANKTYHSVRNVENRHFTWARISRRHEPMTCVVGRTLKPISAPAMSFIEAHKWTSVAYTSLKSVLSLEKPKATVSSHLRQMRCFADIGRTTKTENNHDRANLPRISLFCNYHGLGAECRHRDPVYL